jgi:DNA-binding Lrp family transcriptional regulator
MSNVGKNRNFVSQQSDQASRLVLDDLDIGIIKEMIKDAEVKSSFLASKYDSPLSTIQRRRAKLEHTILKKKYYINISMFHWRRADLMISVDGDCGAAIAELLRNFGRNIISTSLRIGDPQANIVAAVFYRDSRELLNLMDGIRSIASVRSVKWSEVVRDFGPTDAGIETILSPSQT